MIITNQDGVWLDVNPALCEAIGRRREDMIGKAHPELIPSGYQDLRRQVYAGVADDHSFRGEFPLLHADGRLITFEWNITTLRGTDLLLAIATDVSARKTIEHRLKKEAERHARLYEFVVRLNRAESAEDVFNAALEIISADLKSDRASILVADDQGVMRFRAWRGLSEGYRAAVEGHSPWPRDAKDPAPVAIENLANIHIDEALRKTVASEGIAALAFIPLTYKDKLLGKFMVYYDTPHAFTAEELHKAQSIAYQLSSALERKQAEQALRESDRRHRAMADALRISEERYRAVVESQGEMVCRFRMDGTLLFVNHAYARSRGSTPEALVQANFWDFIGEEDRPAVKAMLEGLTPASPEIAIENRFQTMDGERWTLWTNRALTFDEQGRVLEAQSSGIDITERKRAEEALREREERYELVVAGAEAAIWDWDIARKRVVYSPRWKQLRGLADDEVSDSEEEWSKRIHPEDLERVMSDLNAHFEGRSSVFSCEYRIRHKDGRWLWILDRGIAHLDVEGRPVRMAGSETDITGRKRAEEALRESEERFRHMANHSPVIIWVTEADGQRSFLSSSWYELTGRPPGTGLGWGWMDAVHPDDQNSLRRKFLAASRDKQPYRFDYRVRARDGEYRWVINSAVPRLGPQGELLGYIGSLIDITDRKRIEEDLNRAHQRLQDSHVELENRVAERTQLAEARAEKLRELASALTLAEQRERNRLAQILHDHLQQLLIAIKLGVGRIKSETGDPRLRTMIRQIEVLNEEAIDASRSFAVELSPPILRDAGLLPAMEWLARWFKEKHHLNVRITAEPDLPSPSEDVKICLFQSVRELLLNVVKHAGTNGASVDLASGEDSIAITVSDAGRGFDPESIAANATNGFGLFRVLERLELLGGEVAIKSAPGKGARFSLTVPARIEQTKPHIPERSGESAETRKDADDGGIRVLVVDDHRILRQGLINLLNGEDGITVVGEAGNGEEAIRRADELAPDVILMDISMPKINGIDATAHIKARMPQIQVIALSLHDSEDMAQTMRKAGASAYLTKSGPLDELVKTIRQVTERVASEN